MKKIKEWIDKSSNFPKTFHETEFLQFLDGRFLAILKGFSVEEGTQLNIKSAFPCLSQNDLLLSIFLGCSCIL